VEQISLFKSPPERKKTPTEQQKKHRNYPALTLVQGCDKTVMQNEGMLILRMLQGQAQKDFAHQYQTARHLIDAAIHREIQIKKGQIDQELALRDALITYHFYKNPRS